MKVLGLVEAFDLELSYNQLGSIAVLRLSTTFLGEHIFGTPWIGVWVRSIHARLAGSGKDAHGRSGVMTFKRIEWRESAVTVRFVMGKWVSNVPCLLDEALAVFGLLLETVHCPAQLQV